MIVQQAAAGIIDKLAEGLHGEVAVFGSMNADYTVKVKELPQPGETVSASPLEVLPGGKSSNQAAAAALLGASVSMFAMVGDDFNGHFLKKRLQKTGVDISGIKTVNAATGSTLITVDADGENTIAYSAGANALLDKQYVSSIRERLVSASILGLCLETPIEAVESCAQLAHDSGVTVLLNDSPVKPLSDELKQSIDVLLVNEHELKTLIGLDAPDHLDVPYEWNHVIRRLEESGFSRTAVTMGSRGVILLDKGSSFRIPAIHINPVDTTGCGDSFMGALLAGLASKLDLVRAARIATCVSAYAALSDGAQSSYGDNHQIVNFLQKNVDYMQTLNHDEIDC